nr:uncharacterized protein LOC123764691 isoform X3 [Procambarus clarkii]XP_045608622.1 uncharacterized protein LOC123764691 isoform X3 [Procambarus clarkii]XP_045608623.1 uncharacterized protein LOC123764691 isoform X3 [Procambarus clarkii]
MSAASLASFVYARLSSPDADMTGRPRHSLSTPRLTAVWRTKSIPYNIPAHTTSPFKEDGSLLRLLRAKSMPSLVLEEQLAARTRFDQSPDTTFDKSPPRRRSSSSPSPPPSGGRRLFRQRLSQDLREGTDFTSAFVSTPMNSPRDQSPAEQRKLTRSASDGHIWARRKKHLRDVRNEFPVGTLPSVKTLKNKFDGSLEGVHLTTDSGQSDTHERHLDAKGTRYVTNRKSSRHESLERWVGEEVVESHEELSDPLGKTFKKLLQRFETSPPFDSNYNERKRSPMNTRQTDGTEKPPTFSPESSSSPRRVREMVGSQSERKPRLKTKSRDLVTRVRARSEPDPSAIKRLSTETVPVSVKKLKMQFEMQSAQQESRPWQRQATAEPALKTARAPVVSYQQNAARETGNRDSYHLKSELQELKERETRTVKASPEVTIDSKTTPSVRKLKMQFEEALLAQFNNRTIERDDTSKPRMAIKAGLRSPFEGNSHSHESEITKIEEVVAGGSFAASQMFSTTSVRNLLRQFETSSPEETNDEVPKFSFERKGSIDHRFPIETKNITERIRKPKYKSRNDRRPKLEADTQIDKSSSSENEEDTGRDRDTVRDKAPRANESFTAYAGDDEMTTELKIHRIIDEAVKESNWEIDEHWETEQKGKINDTIEQSLIIGKENIGTEIQKKLENTEDGEKDRRRISEEQKEEDQRSEQERRKRERLEYYPVETKPTENKQELVTYREMDECKIAPNREKPEEEKPQQNPEIRIDNVEQSKETTQKRDDKTETSGEGIRDWQDCYVKEGWRTHEADTSGDTSPEKVGELVGKFATIQETEISVPLENSEKDPADYKVGRLIDKFTNPRDMDFEEERQENGVQNLVGGDGRRRLSDVTALVSKFAKINMGDHALSDSEEAIAKARAMAPIPTIPAKSVPGKVRTLKADELRFFETGNTNEPFVRSQSLRTKKSEPPPFTKPRSGSLREKKSRMATLSEPEGHSTAAKASLPGNCRQLRPDELRFFGIEANTIYSVKETSMDISNEEQNQTIQENQSNESQDFRLDSQGDLRGLSGFPGEDNNQSTNFETKTGFETDSDSEESILRGGDSYDAEDLLLVDEPRKLDLIVPSHENSETSSDFEEEFSHQIQQTTVRNVGMEDGLEPLEYDGSLEHSLEFPTEDAAIAEQSKSTLKLAPEKENNCSSAAEENGTNIDVRAREETKVEFSDTEENNCIQFNLKERHSTEKPKYINDSSESDAKQKEAPKLIQCTDLSSVLSHLDPYAVHRVQPLQVMENSTNIDFPREAEEKSMKQESGENIEEAKRAINESAYTSVIKENMCVLSLQETPDDSAQDRTRSGDHTHLRDQSIAGCTGQAALPISTGPLAQGNLQLLLPPPPMQSGFGQGALFLRPELRSKSMEATLLQLQQWVRLEHDYVDLGHQSPDGDLRDKVDHQSPESDLVDKVDHQSPESDLVDKVEHQSPESDLVVKVDHQSPENEIVDKVEHQPPESDLVDKVEHQSPESDLVDKVDHQSPESDLVDKVEHQSPQSDLVVKVEHESPESDLVDKVEHQPPESEIVDKVEHQSPEGDLGDKVKNQSPESDLVVKVDHQSPESDLVDKVEHQSPESDLVDKVEHQSPEGDLGDKVEHQSPESDLVDKVEHQSPESDLVDKVEHQSPESDLVDKVEHQSPEGDLVDKVEHQSPESDLVDKVEHQSPEGDLWDRVEHQPPEGDPWDRVEHQPPKGDPWDRVEHQPPECDLWDRVEHQPPEGDPWDRVEHQPPEGDPWDRVEHQPPEGDPWDRVEHQPPKGNPWDRVEHQPPEGDLWDRVEHQPPEGDLEDRVNQPPEGDLEDRVEHQPPEGDLEDRAEHLINYINEDERGEAQLGERAEETTLSANTTGAGPNDAGQGRRSSVLVLNSISDRQYSDDESSSDADIGLLDQALLDIDEMELNESPLQLNFATYQTNTSSTGISASSALAAASAALAAADAAAASAAAAAAATKAAQRNCSKSVTILSNLAANAENLLSLGGVGEGVRQRAVNDSAPTSTNGFEQGVGTGAGVGMNNAPESRGSSDRLQEAGAGERGQTDTFGSSDLINEREFVEFCFLVVVLSVVIYYISILFS